MIGVVLNRRGGRGRAGRLWADAEARMKATGLEFKMVETTAPGSARSQALELASHGCDVVVGAGGDGTVSDVMQGILATDTALGVLPFGTGNDLARTLGVGPDVDLAVDALIQNRQERLDVAAWSAGGSSGHFINVAGCGFDAEVARRINKGFKFASGAVAYYLAIGATLMEYKPVPMSVTVDGVTHESEVMLCAVANARSYGAGLRIAPTAMMADGLLDVVIVGALRKGEFLANFPKLMKGTHLSHPQVRHLRCTEIVLRAPESAQFLTDGEIALSGEITITAVPAALSVIVGPSFAG